ncbi:hypothetical protein LJB88_02435 [Erysipelotrichaceae bacterium OttesenSCG-928-M19]|nr:hypothetical protein [Erysipelotrichaceae bacterium OttesenSCG-928-M19]
MIIWRGKGIITVLFLVFFIGIVFVGGEWLGYVIGIRKSLGIGSALSAWANYIFVLKFGQNSNEEYLDSENHEEGFFKSEDSLFFIPMKYWTYILGCYAIYMLLF